MGKDNILDRGAVLPPPGSSVVCAVSGGVDSVALLHLLLSHREDLGLELSAAHYNHCLRGAESDEDEAFVRRLCASWGVPLAVGRGDVKAHAKANGQSVEEAARALRYEFLYQQRGLIATAHNADDQAETVLLNLLRGTGLRGLCGISPQQGRLIRPLLNVTRAEIEAYCEENHLPHREDSSNFSDDHLRNRLRHRVLPLLREENPRFLDAVGRMTALLRQDEEFLEAETEKILKQASQADGWDCGILRNAPAVLRKRAIRRLLPNPKPSMAHVEAVEGLVEQTDGTKTIDLTGGWTAQRRYGLLQFEAQKKPPSDEGGVTAQAVTEGEKSRLPQKHCVKTQSLPISLPQSPSATAPSSEGALGAFTPITLLPGQAASLPGTGLCVSVSEPEILQKKLDSLCTFSVKYDRMKPNEPVLVRPRQTGDALRLAGGSRSLKRLMIDRKIPAPQRDLLPVLADGQGVFAVYGLGFDPNRAAQPGDLALIVHLQKEERDI